MSNFRLFLVVVVVSLVTSCESENQFEFINVLKLSEEILNLSFIDVSVTAINTAEGVVLIDTHRSPGIMKSIKQKIESKFGQTKYKYVMNSHAHWDHIGGNQLFPDSIIVAHENTARQMENDHSKSATGLWFIEEKINQFKQELTSSDLMDAEKVEINESISAWEEVHNYLKNRSNSTIPTITFSDSLILHSGQYSFKLYNCGYLHSDNDVIIYSPELQILITGDLFNFF